MAAGIRKTEKGQVYGDTADIIYNGVFCDRTLHIGIILDCQETSDSPYCFCDVIIGAGSYAGPF